MNISDVPFHLPLSYPLINGAKLGESARSILVNIINFNVKVRKVSAKYGGS